MRDLEVATDETSTKFSSYRSGDSLPTMYVGLADPMGQLVGTENNKKLDVSIKSLIVNGSNSNLYQATIAGTSTFYSLNGVYVLQDIIFTGAPGSGYGLSFISDGIDNTKPANVEYLKQLSK